VAEAFEKWGKGGRFKPQTRGVEAFFGQGAKIIAFCFETYFDNS